jgi:hypothetical protein
MFCFFWLTPRGIPQLTAQSSKVKAVLSSKLAGYLSAQGQTAIVLGILLDFIFYGDFCSYKK